MQQARQGLEKFFNQVTSAALAGYEVSSWGRAWLPFISFDPSFYDDFFFPPNFYRTTEDHALDAKQREEEDKVGDGAAPNNKIGYSSDSD